MSSNRKNHDKSSKIKDSKKKSGKTNSGQTQVDILLEAIVSGKELSKKELKSADKYVEALSAFADLHSRHDKEFSPEYLEKETIAIADLMNQLNAKFSNQLSTLPPKIESLLKEEGLPEQVKAKLLDMHKAIESSIPVGTLIKKVEQLKSKYDLALEHQKEAIHQEQKTSKLSDKCVEKYKVLASNQKLTSLINSSVGIIDNSLKYSLGILSLMVNLKECLDKPTVQVISSYASGSPALHAQKPATPQLQSSAPKAALVTTAKK